MNVIGISGLNNSVPFKKKAFPNLSPRYHRIAQGYDAAAALVTSEGVAAAAAEERFTEQKATGSFPVHAIRSCLQQAGVSLDAVDYIAHGFDYEPYKPFFEGSALMKRQFAEVYSREAQLECLQRHFPDHDWQQRFVQVPHHLAHAASVFYLSGFRESLIVVTDGMGEFESTTVAVGRGREIEILRQIPSLHSLGVLYSVFTLYLGFSFHSGEYKVMGLAPYGDPRTYGDKVMGLVHLKKDGTYTIPVLFRNASQEEKETFSATLRILSELLGEPRDPHTEITRRHMDISAALQATLETCLMHVLRSAQQETGQDRLSMAGGVALNCTANGLIHRSKMFRDMFVQPAASDDGSALGAALYTQFAKSPAASNGKMKMPFWGPSYDNQEIGRVVSQYPECTATRFDSFADLSRQTAERIGRGEIVGWFQGAMEFGPRALGNRSILADPRPAAMRDRVNRLVKNRESFRPFAPAVTAEAAGEFFELQPGDEPVYAHMLFATQVRPAYRSQLAAVTHVDGSARVQTVFKDSNLRFWTLLNSVNAVIGVPVVLNTSFNVQEQPIVCTPQQAIETFLKARLDALVIGDYLMLRPEVG